MTDDRCFATPFFFLSKTLIETYRYTKPIDIRYDIIHTFENMYFPSSRRQKHPIVKSNLANFKSHGVRVETKDSVHASKKGRRFRSCINFDTRA
jgi:hypothetical protein